MNTIVQQICENFIKEIINYFGQDRVLALQEIENTLEKKVNSFLLEMAKTYLEQLDRAIVNDKATRRQKGIVIERRNVKREPYLLFGQLSFKRTYFYDKHNKEHVYLLDKAVGLESYNRVSDSVAVNLVNHAGESSYEERSRHVTGGDITRRRSLTRGV